ncbi:MAG: DJ-1 family glyoxalase III [Kiritimatiellia bacterium]
MAKVLVPLVEGFEDIEAVSIIDVLRRGGVDVVTAAVDGAPTVLSSHGLRLSADAAFKDAAEAEYEAIVLPGGPGTDRLKVPAVIARLRRQKEEGRLICAICAAPTVLVEAGVLDRDQHVTCYPTCIPDLDRPSANVPVVADGNVITGQAPGAALLFALVILQALMGEPIARKVARGLVTEVL